MKRTAFQAGDRVVLPPYGIGVISGTCFKAVGPETSSYYQVEFEQSSSRAYVPVQAPDPTGMRAALTTRELPELLRALQDAELDLPRQWSARHQRVMDIVASAQPYELAALVGQLYRWNRQRTLPDLDRQAYRRAVKLLEGEVRGLGGRTADAIRVFLEHALLETATMN